MGIARCMRAAYSVEGISTPAPRSRTAGHHLRRVAQMPYHCVAKAQRALNDSGMSVKGARVTVVGVSYKPGVGDMRESPALKIISLLRDLGGEVAYHDPHVPALAEFALESVPLERAVAETDLVLIVTAHPTVDHELIARRARLVLDLRGITRHADAANVVRL